MVALHVHMVLPVSESVEKMSYLETEMKLWLILQIQEVLEILGPTR